MRDLIDRQGAIDALKQCYCGGEDVCGEPWIYEEHAIKAIYTLPSAQLERKWIPCSNPPKHHRDVLVRGNEAIGNSTVYKVMQWDVDTWRPVDYAPSIIWQEWSEI